MIDYIKGILTEVRSDNITLEVNGVGYEVLISGRSLAQLPPLSSSLRVYTHLQVLENEFKLYGFMTREEQQLFLTLLGVSGIGARGALNILGSMDPERFYAAVASQDEKLLLKAPGIGKKMAQRLMFELRDKIPDLVSISGDSPGSSMTEDILEALEALGYNRSEVFPTLRELTESGQLGGKIEDNIRLILKRKANQAVR